MERIRRREECGSNVFQGYYDDAKESRVKQSFNVVQHTMYVLTSTTTLRELL